MIPKQFIKTQILHEDFKEFVQSLPPEHINGIESEIQNPSTGRYWEYDLSECYRKEYEQYITENVFFIGCNYKTYVENYQARLDEYLKVKVDAFEIDFIIKDYNSMCAGYQFSFSPDDIKEQIEISLRRQRELLEQKIVDTGYQLIKTTNKWGDITYSYVKTTMINDDTPSIDLSIDTSLAKKITFLHLLGVIEYLKNRTAYGYSTQQIANILSAIIGEKAGTIQSYINPIDKPNVGQKNNPLNNKERVGIIKQQIIELGFKLSD